MPEASHILQSGYFHPTLRKWQCPNVDISPHNLMFPIFIGNFQEPVEVFSMPGVYRYGIHHLNDVLSPLVNKGLKSILLFGIPDNLKKDDNASSADCPQNPIIEVLPKLRKSFPDLIIACDVCLCPYSSHGHCGILNEDGTVNRELSVKRIAEVALNYAKAGAHIVAPSDMMDGRVKEIKKALIQNGFGNKVAVLSYAAKFASGLYGPFRDATGSAPAFGDRQCYQLPPGSIGLAMRATNRDVEEGADMLMVKPGLPYLDIAKLTKEAHPNHPLFLYQVSGEYSMLYHAAKLGTINLKSVLEEILVSMRRAGVDCIISYFTPMILDFMHESKSKY